MTKNFLASEADFAMPPARRYAFTTIEMLVVAAIIALLAALTFGIFLRQRDSAYRANCQSNTSQIFKAVQMYVQDYDSLFPAYDAWPVLLQPYVKSDNIFHCPVLDTHSEFHPDIDYVPLPERIAHLTRDLKGRYRHLSAHEATITTTSDWILMMDYGGAYVTDREQVVYPQTCATELLGQTFFARDFPVNHTGGGNYLFADGHAKWMLPTKAMKTDCAAGPFLPSYLH